MTRNKLLMTCSVAVVTAALAIVARAQTDNMKDRFTFAAANGSKAGPRGEGRLELVVTRWSSDAECDRVLSAVTEGGPDKLRDALGDSYVAGWIHWPGNLDYTVRYARRMPRAEGGEDVVLVTDSRTWIGWNSPDFTGWTDSPFTVIHLRLNRDGAGEGKLSLGNKIRGDKEAGVVLENYATEPTFLTEVRREKNAA